MDRRIGTIIKELRLENNLTQPELAKKIGVSNGIISLWENNVNEPKASHIRNLALIFNVSADYLLNIDFIEGNTSLVNAIMNNNGVINQYIKK